MASPFSKRREVRLVQPDGAVLFRGTSLCVRVAVLKPGCVLATARGEVIDAEDGSAEDGAMAELDAELERAGTLMLFVDLRESPRMPAPSREKIALWLRRHQARLVPSHVLVGSKILEMALSIITMLVGGGVLKVHSRPPTFLELIRKTYPKLSELPRIPPQSELEPK